MLIPPRGICISESTNRSVIVLEQVSASGWILQIPRILNPYHLTSLSTLVLSKCCLTNWSNPEVSIKHCCGSAWLFYGVSSFSVHVLFALVLVTFSHGNFAVPSQYPTLLKFIFVIANKRLTVLRGCSIYNL